MKTMLSIILLSTLYFNATAQSQEGKVEIKTSAICEMCQHTIEKDMAFEKGVKSAVLDLDTKILAVEFNPKKTDADKIRTRLSMIGYDADSVLRDDKAHAKLPFCCQSDANRAPVVDHGDGKE